MRASSSAVPLVYEGTPYSDLSTSDGEDARDFDMRPVKTHPFRPQFAHR